MLTIRQAQLAVFSQLEVQKFEDWTLAHLQKFFPRQCATLGERQVRESIRHGVRRAAHYGITAKRDVCKYIDLMIVFGAILIRTGNPAGPARSSANPETPTQRCVRCLWQPRFA